MCQYFEQPQQRLRKGSCLRYTTGNPRVIPALTALLHLRRWHRSQGGQATSASSCLWPLCPWTGSAHRAGMVLELLRTPHPPFRWSWCFHSNHAEWLGEGKKKCPLLPCRAWQQTRPLHMGIEWGVQGEWHTSMAASKITLNYCQIHNK